jgi:hypothetical protein
MRFDQMDFWDAMFGRRSTRRFKENVEVKREDDEAGTVHIGKLGRDKVILGEL